ncbi:argininosuccinate lyase [Candidatus Woesearchaeota archaeon]|nr:argininosuccinate lyase [Candidatus Woesearchaeota archaeon]
MKLWEKNNTAVSSTAIDKAVEQFTVGDDFLIDMHLIQYDISASIAHAKTLLKSGILKEQELKQLICGLQKLSALVEKKEFFIKQEEEDMHTAIENYLVSELGEIGKKIHTGRSRNDQVLVALRLYCKEQLILLKEQLVQLIESIINIAKKNEFVPLVGYTHMQKAMPSSVGILFGAYAESLLDNFQTIDAAFSIADQCPLGSGAGYGVSIELDRNYTAELLGFKKTQNNVAYVQNSRGKIELTILHSLSMIMQDLGRIANDLILFSMDEFGYISLPDRFCTGSSIMPQKKNPDVLELIRGKTSVVQAHYFLVQSIVSKLISGYNRDLQLTKKPMIESFQICIDSIAIMNNLLRGIIINEDKCLQGFSAEVFAADNAYELVKKGMTFRDAYKEVGNALQNNVPQNNELQNNALYNNKNNQRIIDKEKVITNIKSKTNNGHTGNAGLNLLEKDICEIKEIIKNAKFT